MYKKTSAIIYFHHLKCAIVNPKSHIVHNGVNTILCYVYVFLCQNNKNSAYILYTQCNYIYFCRICWFFLLHTFSLNAWKMLLYRLNRECRVNFISYTYRQQNSFGNHGIICLEYFINICIELI